RSTANPLDSNNSQTVSFSNSLAFKEYLIIFPAIKATDNSMQIGDVQLYGTAPVASLIWAGTAAANGNRWNIGSNANWTSSGRPAKFADGSSVQFDDTAANTNVSVSTTVQPSTVTFQNTTAKAYTISGSAITTAGSLVLNGTGSVTLN